MRFLLSCTAVAAAAALSFAVWPSPVHATPNNPFAGEWCGTFFTVDDPSNGGTVELSISSSGVITGSFLNTTANIPGTMHGRIRADGSIGLNPNIYGPGPGGQGANGEHHAGVAYIDDDGKLVIPTTGVWNGGYEVLAVLELCD